jgi:predicted ABC-type transport system involved in lysophospholipase L1 biosynthesis ATPase subunit
MTEAIVRCESLVQVYGLLGQEVTALRGVDLTVTAGETVACSGRRVRGSRPCCGCSPGCSARPPGSPRSAAGGSVT